MRVLDSEKVWAPPNQTEIWTLVPEGTTGKLTYQTLMEFQGEMLGRMLSEATPDEKATVNEMIREEMALPKGMNLEDLEPEVALTDATYVKIGPKGALRDGNLVTAEGWTALAAFIREFLAVLGTEIVHHPIGETKAAEAAE